AIRRATSWELWENESLRRLHKPARPSAAISTRLEISSLKVLALQARFCYALPGTSTEQENLSSESSGHSLNCSRPRHVPQANSLRWRHAGICACLSEFPFPSQFFFAYSCGAAQPFRTPWV